MAHPGRDRRRRTPLTRDSSSVLFPADRPVPPPWALTPEQVAAQITPDVHAPAATVLGLSQEPGTLDRYGPISAQQVRLVRPKSYRRILVDARSGRPLAVDDKPTPAAATETGRREQIRAMLRPDVVIDGDEPQHDPPARLARLIDVRDRHCCGPGCSSSRYDRDHLETYASGGKTNARNLGPVSRRCHNAKTHSGWILKRHHPDHRARPRPRSPTRTTTTSRSASGSDHPTHRNRLPRNRPGTGTTTRRSSAGC